MPILAEVNSSQPNLAHLGAVLASFGPPPMALTLSKLTCSFNRFDVFDVGPSWLQLRVLCSMLGHLGVILSALGALLGPSWALLGAILDPLGALLRLGPSWDHLGAIL